MNDITDYLLLTAGGTASLGVLVWAIKHIVLQAFSGKSAVINVQANDAIITRLHNEIARLEVIIANQKKEYESALSAAQHEREEDFKKLRADVERLESKIEEIHGNEILDAADIAELTVLFDTFCTGCHAEDDQPSKKQIQDIIVRLRSRRFTNNSIRLGN